MADQANTNGTPHIRTFAKDFAKLSGKNPAASPVPVIQKIQKKTVPPPPPAQTTTEAGVTVKEQEPIAPPARQEKGPEPLVVPPAAPTPPVVEPSAPLAAPDATRDAVLARLRTQAGTPPAQPTAPSRDEILARLRAKAAGEAAPVRPTAIPPPLHTYKSDFAERVQATKASPLAVLAAEQDVAGKPKPQSVAERKAERPFYLIGIALIIVAIAGTFAAYYFVYRTPLVPAVPTVPSLVFADERAEVSGTGGQLMSAIVAQASDPLPSGQVRILYTATSTRTDNGLLRSALPMGPLIATLPVEMPPLLARSIQDESTVGVMSAGGETRAFFILRVDSFERSFAGMLAWEPSMRGRLSLFYPAFEPPQPVSTSTPPAPLISTAFVDEVVANHDARVLYDGQGRVLMLYGYYDKETLVIARNKASFEQLMERLSTTR